MMTDMHVPYLYNTLTRRSLSVIMAYDRRLIDPQHVYNDVLYNVSIRQIINNLYYSNYYYFFFHFYFVVSFYLCFKLLVV